MLRVIRDMIRELTVAARGHQPVSLAAAETEFLRRYAVRSQGGALCLRPRRAGSYLPEKGRLAKFLKSYLVEIERSDAFDRELVDRLRDYLLADAEPLAKDELLTRKLD